MSNVLSARASRSLGNSCFDSNTYEMDMMCRGDSQRRRARRGGRAVEQAAGDGGLRAGEPPPEVPRRAHAPAPWCRTRMQCEPWCT